MEENISGPEGRQDQEKTVEVSVSGEVGAPSGVPLKTETDGQKNTHGRKSNVAVIGVIAVSALVVFLIISYFRSKEKSDNTQPLLFATITPVSQPETEAVSPTIASEEEMLSEKTYSNPNFPDFEIKYDLSWDLAVSEEENTAIGGGAVDSLISLKKDSTTLYFDIRVGAPTGSEPQCFSVKERPYSLVSDSLLRFKDDAFGNYYLMDAVVKEVDENKFADLLSVFTDAFPCQQDNSCTFCHYSGDGETTRIRTNYDSTMPVELQSEDNKYEQALLRVYAKQDYEDLELLQQANKIVQESLK